jgi:hypothetical protein
MMLRTRVWLSGRLATMVVSCATGAPDVDTKVTVIKPDAQDVSRPLSELIGGLLASDLDGATLPPAGEPNFLMALDTNALDFFKLHVDFTTPANSTFTAELVLKHCSVAAPLTSTPSARSCAARWRTTARRDGAPDRHVPSRVLHVQLHQPLGARAVR